MKTHIAVAPFHYNKVTNNLSAVLYNANDTNIDLLTWMSGNGKQTSASVRSKQSRSVFGEPLSLAPSMACYVLLLARACRGHMRRC